MIRIGQASSSETFTNNGTAPNQRRTGATVSKPEGNLDGELNVIPWKGGWECIYRPTDEKVAEYLATFVYSAIANGKGVGYSWKGNTQLFDACKKMTIPNPARITTPVNCDCATLVGAGIYFAGIKDNRLRALCTWQMDDVLLSTGKFKKITDKDMCENGKGIKRGDILWKTGHTAVALDSDTSSSKKDFGVRDLQGDSYYLYSQKGTASYTLESDMTYLVTYCERNNTVNTNDAAWIISTHKNASHLFSLKSSDTTKASINKLSLTITRGSIYGRVTITRLS